MKYLPKKRAFLITLDDLLELDKIPDAELWYQFLADFLTACTSIPNKDVQVQIFLEQTQ